MDTRKNLKEGLHDFQALSRPDQEWVLSGLRKDLRGREANAAQLIATRIALPRKMTSVFLSHNHADKAFVRSLSRFLRENDIKVWLDEAELNAGDSLVQTISEVVRDVDFLVGVLSPASIASPWVQRELGWAMHSEINGRRIKVIPIVKDKCEIPAYLLGKLYLDFTTKYSRSKNRQILLGRIQNQVKFEEAESGPRD